MYSIFLNNKQRAYSADQRKSVLTSLPGQSVLITYVLDRSQNTLREDSAVSLLICTFIE